MEKQQLYKAPIARELEVRFDASFLQSSATGPINPWIGDEDSIDF